MKTEKDMIHGLNNIMRELQEKEKKLKELSPQLKTSYKRVLLLEINQLKGQRQALENMLIIG